MSRLLRGNILFKYTNRNKFKTSNPLVNATSLTLILHYLYYYIGIGVGFVFVFATVIIMIVLGNLSADDFNVDTYVTDASFTVRIILYGNHL